MIKPARSIATFQFAKVLPAALMVALLLIPAYTALAEDNLLPSSAAGLLKTPLTYATAAQPSRISSAKISLTPKTPQGQTPASQDRVAYPPIERQEVMIEELVADKYSIAAEKLAAITRQAKTSKAETLKNSVSAEKPQTVVVAESTKRDTPPEKAVETPQKVAAAGPTDMSSKAMAPKRAAPQAPRLMNLNFFNADIQRVLSALAMQHEINIISSKDVGGPISIHLYRVTLAEALDAVAMASGFSYITRGDSYYFYKPKEEKDPQAEKLGIRVFKLKYADSWKTEDFEKVKEILGAIPGMRTISIHESSKTIIVEDTPENLEKIEQVIGFWDTMPKQVMIEARILEVTLNDDMRMGVNWEQVLGDARIGTGGFSTAELPTAAAAAVSPVPTAGVGIFGNLISGAGSSTQFAMAIDALSTITDVRTLSAPKILAIHGKTARVQVGGKQGYTETTTTNVAATETIKFLDTGTTLSITPYIDDQGNVLLDVDPEISSVTLNAGGIPTVTTTAVSTRLLAKNGQTVFIAGLIRSELNNTRNEIPCLGSMPVVGPAFGRKVTEGERRELVVLITPNVVGLDKPSADQQNAIDKVKKAQKELEHDQPVKEKKQ